MTRETKIGLLVGLAFIIVIGILLSDHMTSTTDPPQAKLEVAADNVRAGIATPAPAGSPVAATGGATLVGQPLAAPTQPVLTRGDLRPPPEPQPAAPAPRQPGYGQVVQHVEVGTPAAAYPPIVIHGESAQQSGAPAGGGQARVYVEAPAREPTQPPVTVVPNMPVAGAQPAFAEPSGAGRTPPPGGWDWAQRMGEEIVSTDDRGGGRAPVAPGTVAAAPGGPFEYKAEAGDTLSKLAGRFMGGNTKTNRDLIVRANPSLKDKPDRVIVGRTYVIPAGANAPVPQQPAPRMPVVLEERPVALTTTTPFLPAEPRRAAATGEPALAPGQVWYAVRENDNLWKIAAEQLGSGNAWLQVRDLNKDILKGGDTVVPKMRLRLPARPVASAG